MNTQQVISYIGWAAFFVYATLTQGCAPAPAPTSWYVASPELREAAQAAADAWCESSDGEWCPVVDDPQGAPIVLDEADEPGRCGSYSLADSTIRVFRHSVEAGGCWIVAADGGPGDRQAELAAIIAHEMGHERMGKRGTTAHSADADSLMASSAAYWTGAIRPEDVDFVLGY